MKPKRLMPGVWRSLFRHALRLIDEIEKRTPDVFWTFGGGTVLTLYYRHRRSKDIDIFVTDPQYLGFVTPRLSPIAEAISQDYVETANHVKLIRPEGEIDFVAAPNLTEPAFELWRIEGRKIRVETPVEVVAKKMWHRGDVLTARDLLDFALVTKKTPKKLASFAHFLIRHWQAFLEQLRTREKLLRTQFEQIDMLNYRSSFDDCVNQAERFLNQLTR